MKELTLFTEDNLKEFGKEYIKIITTLLIKSGKKSSGSLIKSLNYKIQADAKKIQTVIESFDYLEYVDKGRKPGTYPNITAISKWVRMKGISQDAVFPIARSIFKFGIKPTNVISKTIKEIERGNSLTNKYEKYLVDNIETIIVNDFKK